MARSALVVMGVSGAGKTTIAEMIADELGWAQAEADDFHPPENVAKMESGLPLTDEDRRPWLLALRDWINAQPGSVVITCSALKRSYRDVLRTADAEVRFLHLHGDPELILDRMEDREDHFMPPALLESQLDTLEELDADEPGIVINIDAEPKEIVRRSLKQLALR